MDEKKVLKRPYEVSCPGERYRQEYAPHVMDDGTIELVADGMTDLQEMYNSQAASCDMSLIVQRYLQGDVSVLSRVQGVFADVTAFPKSNAELLQKVIDGQRAFEALPLDIRDKFGNDFNRWFATAGTEDWYKHMSALQTAKKSVPDETGEETEES